LTRVAETHDVIVTIEQGTVVNGFGAAVAAELERRRDEYPDLRIEILGVPDRIIDHADRGQQLAELGLDVTGIAASVRNAAKRSHIPPVRETA